MAELAGSAAPRLADQLRAIASVRWQLMRNNLRTGRGRLELVSRILTGFWFSVLALGGIAGFAAGGWYFVHRGTPEWIAVLLWPLFAFWQVFPLASSAFMEHADTSYLARFPLSYGAYFWVRIAYGSLDAATAVGTACLLGLTIGCLVAAPGRAAAVVAAVVLFALFNIGLAQMIFAWLERWLAKRRTREIVGVLFFLGIFAVNFIGPLVQRWHGRAPGSLTAVIPVSRWLPPGLAAQMIAAPWGRALAAALLLGGYTAAVLALLSLRLRAEYRGEILGEEAAAPRPRKARKQAAAGASGWSGVPAANGPAAAVAGKELRYLLRSPMIFLSLAMPIILLVLFRMQGAGGGRGGAFGPERHWTAAGFGFPVGCAYAVLALSNLVYNAFGTDAVGVNLYFLAPVRFRQVLQGKNLCYGLMVAFEVAFVYGAALLIDGRPSAWITAVTVLGAGFALLVTLSAGNLVSLYLPKKMDLSRMGRQNARGMTGIIAMAVLATVGGFVAVAVLAGLVFHRAWITPAALILLSAAAAGGYGVVLGRAEALALSKREVLIAELSKA